MIRRNPYWGPTEWIIAILWKLLAGAICAVMTWALFFDQPLTHPEWVGDVIFGFYAVLGLLAFLFTQADV